MVQRMLRSTLWVALCASLSGSSSVSSSSDAWDYNYKSYPSSCDYHGKYDTSGHVRTVLLGKPDFGMWGFESGVFIPPLPLVCLPVNFPVVPSDRYWRGTEHTVSIVGEEDKGEETEWGTFSGEKSMSPINIESATPSSDLHALEFTAPACQAVKMANDGTSYEIDFHDTCSNFGVHFGSHHYHLEHIEMHAPSEHTVGSARFAAELQL
eukprot:1394986-Amorphochlora_amoeboformis.AAC.1